MKNKGMKNKGMKNKGIKLFGVVLLVLSAMSCRLEPEYFEDWEVTEQEQSIPVPQPTVTVNQEDLKTFLLVVNVDGEEVKRETFEEMMDVNVKSYINEQRIIVIVKTFDGYNWTMEAESFEGDEVQVTISKVN